MSLVWRDISVLSQGGRALALSCFFLVLAASLFPFAVGPDAKLLSAIAPGVHWLLALFLAVLHGERIFVEDEQDGSLEQLRALGFAEGSLMLSRIIAHWVIAFAPQIALTGVVDVFLGAGLASAGQHMLSLLIGTPALSCLAVLAAALTLGARQSSLLMIVIVFPLMIPPLIFGVSAAADGGAAALMLLGASSLISLVAAPLAGHFALKAALK